VVATDLVPASDVAQPLSVDDRDRATASADQPIVLQPADEPPGHLSAHADVRVVDRGIGVIEMGFNEQVDELQARVEQLKASVVR
jgi:hypothetical protein